MPYLQELHTYGLANAGYLRARVGEVVKVDAFVHSEGGEFSGSQVKFGKRRSSDTDHLPKLPLLQHSCEVTTADGLRIL